MFSSKVYIGWFQAFFTVLVLWGLNNVALGYSVQILDSNPIVLTCVLFSSASFVLLLIGGYGPLSVETIRSIDTWGYGISLLILYILGILLFKEVGATEGSFLQRVSVLFSILFGWLFLSRKPNFSQTIGGILIFIGILIVSVGIASDKIATVILIVFFWSLSHMARVFIAELHRPHSAAVQSQDPRSRCRVIGFIMFIVSMSFTTLILILAFINILGETPVLSFVPSLVDFMNPVTMFVGIVLGVLLMAPLRYLEFASANAIKAENLLAVTCFGSFATLFWEWLTQPLTGLSLKQFTQTDMLAGAIITAGGLVMAVSKIRQIGKKDNNLGEYLYVETQALEQVANSLEIVTNTLEHFRGDVEKSAQALGITVDAVNALLADEEKVLAFHKDMLAKVSRNYLNKVASCDSLTGLLNRSGFMNKTKKALGKHKTATVLFIDLDKFKPVNDNYGHEAGDKVLQNVAIRLSEFLPKDSLIARLGGDEFCAIILGTGKYDAEPLIPPLQIKLAKPITVDGIDETIAITASIGLSSFPEDGNNIEALLKQADKGMYRSKDR